LGKGENAERWGIGLGDIFGQLPKLCGLSAEVWWGQCSLDNTVCSVLQKLLLLFLQI